MSYTRYTNRKNERANDRDAARMTRTEENQLTYKVLSALLAAGLVMSPTAVDASDITDANKQTVYAPTKEGIYNIYAQKIHNKNAINEFEKFQLDANHIANLYFHIEGGTINAENLLNFVNTRIDINGTLNAIKDGKIGGNLFFLSPGGMVVGKSGVINTGSLYVMAPSWTQNLKDKDQRSYEILKGNFATGAYEDTELEGIKNGAANIRINASGTISVLGKINAANDVKLYAGKVAVGKNLTGETIDGTAAGGIEKGAAINTGVTDFSRLVNLSAEQQKNIGLTSLTATKDGNGDVVLSARSDAVNSLDQTFNDLVNTTGLLGSTDINVPKTITASVENYGTVTAAGDATLTAKATNGYFNEGEEPYSSNASSDAQAVARVDVQGDVTAQGAVEMKASADNTYVDSGTSITDKLGDTISYVVPVSANVMLLKNEASVTVGKDATVTGDTVKAEAEANLDGTAGTVAAGKKYLKQIPSQIPATGVSYAQVDNKANVQIDGTVKATGQDTTDSDGNKQEALQVKADATSSVTNSANAVVGASPLGGGSAQIVTAVHRKARGAAAQCPDQGERYGRSRKGQREDGCGRHPEPEHIGGRPSTGYHRGNGSRGCDCPRWRCLYRRAGNGEGGPGGDANSHQPYGRKYPQRQQQPGPGQAQGPAHEGGHEVRRCTGNRRESQGKSSGEGRHEQGFQEHGYGRFQWFQQLQIPDGCPGKHPVRRCRHHRGRREDHGRGEIRQEFGDGSEERLPEHLGQQYGV